MHSFAPISQSHSRLLCLVLLLSLALGSSAAILPAQVSVWDDSVPEDILGGIYPIGGSDEVNQNFVVSTLVQNSTEALQLGLRALGTAEFPAQFDGDRQFLVAQGVTADLANWDYDMHLDFGTTYLGTQTALALDPQTMVDYRVFLQVDIDPGIGVDFVGATIPAVIDPILLLQSRQNVLVGNLSTGPFPGLVSPGRYLIRLSLQQPSGAEVVSTEIEVVVQGPLTIPTVNGFGLAVLTLLLAGCSVLGLRRFR